MHKTFLTYAGAIPFILCAVFLSADIQQLPLLGSVKKILSVYGLVILSFLAGAHWGQQLHLHKGLWDRWLAILSNLVAVSLWLGFLVLSFEMLMILFLVTLIILLVIDYRLFQESLITHRYFKTRCLVSTIVLGAIIIARIVS